MACNWTPASPNRIPYGVGWRLGALRFPVDPLDNPHSELRLVAYGLRCRDVLRRGVLGPSEARSETLHARGGRESSSPARVAVWPDGSRAIGPTHLQQSGSRNIPRPLRRTET